MLTAIERSHPDPRGLVLFVHGFAGSPKQFDAMTGFAFSQGYSTRAIVLPGHGGAGREFQKSTREQWLRHVADETREALARHERVYLVGHSMGCLLSLCTAAELPVRGLLLLACPMRLRGFIAPSALRLRINALRSPDSDAIKAAYIDGSGIPITPAIVRRVLRPARELLLLTRHTAALLPEVRIPVRAIFSSGDELVHPASCEVLLSGLTNTQASSVMLRDSLHSYYTPGELAIIEKEATSMLE